MRYRWFIDKDKQTDEYGVPVSRAEYDEALHPQPFSYQRGEKLAIGLVAIILLYELFNDDSPIIYLCLSFLTFELRPLAKRFWGKNGQAVSNAMAGFSVAVFIGTLFWLFW